jgi:RHS repeat-associated protein
VARQSYFPYGSIRAVSGVMPTKIAFTGQYTDDTGLMYFQARYLSPVLGRFISADTIVPEAVDPQAFNRYSYTYNNPVKYTDPTGHRIDDGCGTEGCATDEYWVDNYVQYVMSTTDFTDNSDNPEGQLTLDFFTWTLDHLTPEAGPVTTAAALVDATQASRALIEGTGRSAAETLEMQRELGNLYDFMFVSAAFAKTQAHAFRGRLPKAVQPASNCSFSADTVVATEAGEQAISALTEGDLVLAYDEVMGLTGFYTVTATWAHVDAEIVYLTIDGERIETTSEHPFFTRQDGWLPAGELWVGAQVRNAEGEYGSVEAVEVARHPQPMYNLTVARAHTFFVGEQQWLVHNQCPPKAYKVADHVQRNGGPGSPPPPGYRGGRVFQNDGRGGGQRLPSLDVDGNPITYYEYDINPYVPGVNRGPERIVIGTDGSRYYTNNHYRTFTQY